MGAAIVTNGSTTLWPFRDDTFPSRNAISKAPRAAAIAVAISSFGASLTPAVGVWLAACGQASEKPSLLQT